MIKEINNSPFFSLGHSIIKLSYILWNLFVVAATTKPLSGSTISFHYSVCSLVKNLTKIQGLFFLKNGKILIIFASYIYIK